MKDVAIEDLAAAIEAKASEVRELKLRAKGEGGEGVERGAIEREVDLLLALKERAAAARGAADGEDR